MSTGTQTGKDQPNKADETTDKATSNIKQTAHEAAAKAEHATHSAASKANETIDKAASAAKHTVSEAERRLANAESQAPEAISQVVDKAAESIKQTAAGATQQLRTTQHEIADRVTGIKDGAAEQLWQAAESIRNEVRTSGGSPIPQAEELARSLERAATYLEEHDFNEMERDARQTIQRNPWQSVGVALAAGYLLASILRPRR